MSSTVTRRGFLKALGASAGAAVLAACTPQATPTPVVKIVKETVAVKETVVSKPAGPVTVTQYINANIFAEAEAFLESQSWTIHLPKFNKANKDVQLRAEPVSYGEFLKTLAAQTAAKELGNALLWITDWPLSDFVRNKLVIPIDDVAKQAGVDLAALYDKRALDLCRFDPATNKDWTGPLYALPMLLNPGFCDIMINTSMLKEVGADMPTDKWTYDDILAAGKKCVIPGKRWGYLMNYWGKTHGIDADYGYVAPWGGYVIDRTGKKALINSKESMDAWQWYYDLIYTHQVAPTSQQYTDNGNYRDMHMAQKLCMFRNGPWGAMHYATIPKEGEKGHYDVATIAAPGHKSGRPGTSLSVDCYGISVNATDPVACLKALLWMTNKDAASYRAKGVFMVGATKDFFTDPEMLKIPLVAASIKAAANCELPYKPANNRGKEINDLLNQQLPLIDTGQQKITQAFFDDVAAKMQVILDKPAP